MTDETEQETDAEPIPPTLPTIRGTMLFGDGKVYPYTNDGGKARALMVEKPEETADANIETLPVGEGD